ncbi:MFS transporter [Chloroflexota bacterium]
MKSVFPILAISTFSAMLGAGIIAPILPLYAENLGASGIWIGVIFAGFSISRTLFMPIVGNLSDKKGRRIFICIGLFAYTVISLGYVWANSVIELTLVRLVHGGASAMIIPIAQAYIGELSPEGEEGKWMGYFNAAFFTGFGFGPLMGGVLTDYFTENVAFYTMGALNLLAFILAFLFLPEIDNRKVSTGDSRTSFFEMRESGVMKGLVSYQIVYAIGRGSFFTFLPLFGATSLTPELTAGQIGALLAIHMLIVSTTQLLSGKIADVFNRKGLIIAGGLVSVTFLALVPATHNFWQLLALCIFGALGGTLSLPAASALAVDEGKKYGMGSTFGIFNMAMSTGMIAGPLIGGLIADTMNISSIFYFGAGMGLLGTALFAWFTR